LAHGRTYPEGVLEFRELTVVLAKHARDLGTLVSSSILCSFVGERQIALDPVYFLSVALCKRRANKYG
jgi:hypothetical protein